MNNIIFPRNGSTVEADDSFSTLSTFCSQSDKKEISQAIKIEVEWTKFKQNQSQNRDLNAQRIVLSRTIDELSNQFVWTLFQDDTQYSALKVSLANRKISDEGHC